MIALSKSMQDRWSPERLTGRQKAAILCTAVGAECAAKITAGEIADPGAAMQAFQQAMMSAMMKAAGGMMGGAQDVAVPNGGGDAPADGSGDEPLP